MVPLRYNTRSLLVRKTTSLAAIFGIALVVFVLAGSLMLQKGIEKTLGQSGRDDNVIVLRKGSDAEISSNIEEPNVGLILAAPGVKRDASGAPLGVGEAILVATMDKIGTEGITNVQIRGVPEKSMEFRPNVKIVAGRPPGPGADEAMVGKSLRGRIRGLDLEQTFEMRKNRPVKVVGIFEDGGSSSESEVWVPLDVVRTSFGREGMVSAVRVRLESPSKFEAFKLAVEQDKNLGFEAIREPTYLEKQSESTALFVNLLGVAICLFFSVGAMIGAMITMYASIANRQREIGTLRALGFSRSGILFSFLLESVLLALAGGVVGAVASMSMKFVTFSMLNMASWSEIVFSFEPTPGIIVSSIVFAGVMGVLGGFFPAVRAARVSPAVAMRG